MKKEGKAVHTYALLPLNPHAYVRTHNRPDGGPYHPTHTDLRSQIVFGWEFQCGIGSSIGVEALAGKDITMAKREGQTTI